MITSNDIVITLIACLGFIMVFLFIFKMHMSNNKALLNEIDKITNNKSIINSNYKELTTKDFGEIIMELKKINYYPELFIEIECGYCKNIAMSIAKGIPKALGIETSKKNVKKGLEILEKLPKSVSKNINIEYQELEDLNLPIIDKKTLLLINNQNYSEELNNKIFDKLDKNIIVIVNKIPNNCKINILKKTDNYILLNNSI